MPEALQSLAEPRSPCLRPCSHWLSSGSLSFNPLALRSLHTQILFFSAGAPSLSPAHPSAPPFPLPSASHTLLSSLSKTMVEGTPEEPVYPGCCLQGDLPSMKRQQLLHQISMRIMRDIPGLSTTKTFLHCLQQPCVW